MSTMYTSLSNLIKGILIIFIVLAAGSDLNAQKKKKQKKNKADTTIVKPKPTKKSDLKAYNEIITKEAATDSGMFLLHKVAETYFFEIPDSLLGRDMLIVSRRAAMSGSEKDATAVGERVKEGLMVRWEKAPDNKHILLRKVTTENVMRYTGTDTAFQQAIALQALDPILLSMPIKTISKDSTSSVVDIADLFLADINELTPFSSGGILTLLGLKAPKKYIFKKDRSFIEKAISFGQNIEVRSLLTYTQTDKSGTNTFTILVHRSMVLLPDDVMRPRIADERIGHFAQSFSQYHEDSPVKTNYHLKRWRLEAREEDEERSRSGQLVEPEKKIIFYLDKSTPQKWRKYIKQGVEDWIPAFEEAGFKNAIEARDIPNDPDFHPEDIRYSVIRYTASPISNAKGPSVTDPRSGEILESDVIIYHNILKTLRDWRFSQTAANDKRVQTPIMPDSLIGEGLRYVVAHEVGHAIGLRHNMGASYAFPVDSLRSASFTQKYGTTPSIMDYARFNYIAQPEDDGIQLAPQIGVYDKYAIKWAYKTIWGVESQYDEKSTLDEWIMEHAGDPFYYFGEGDLSGRDPGSQRESLGDDVVMASEYGVENIKYIIDHLDEWLLKEGEKYDTIEDLYSAVLRQYRRYLGHVGTLIGGTYLRRPIQGEEEVAYRYVPKEKQREAVYFLLKQYKELPTWLENEDLKAKLNIMDKRTFVRRIVTPSTYIERLYSSSFIVNLLNDGKLMALIDDELRNGSKAYTAADLFHDVNSNLFSQTRKGGSLNHYEQLLQVEYVDWLLGKNHFKQLVDFKPATVSDDPFPTDDLQMQCEISSEEMKDKTSGVQGAFDDQLYFQVVNVSRNDKAAKISALTLLEVTRLRQAISKNKDTGDPWTRAHYNYLLRKIDVYLKN